MCERLFIVISLFWHILEFGFLAITEYADYDCR